MLEVQAHSARIRGKKHPARGILMKALHEGPALRGGHAAVEQHVSPSLRPQAANAEAESEAVSSRLGAWRERWAGLRRWFLSDARGPSQSELLRRSALSAIPRLLQAVSALNERRAGRSDRAADFRRLVLWLLDAGSDRNAHRLWRAAFLWLNSLRRRAC